MDLQAVAPNAARELLAANELPTDDLDEPSIILIGAFDGGALIGVVGLQSFGEVGLLRSLAVVPAHRERGIARVLCERVLELARERSLAAVYLLTTSAADYFLRHGFVAIARDAAPPKIRASAQFSSLCPGSARLMVRSVMTGACAPS